MLLMLTAVEVVCVGCALLASERKDDGAVAAGLERHFNDKNPDAHLQKSDAVKDLGVTCQDAIASSAV